LKIEPSPPPRGVTSAASALREARTEAVFVLALDIALFVGLATVDRTKHWEI
jgi:hypothetical protein